MAIKPCRACKQQVSTDAKSCPHCGAPRPASPGGMTGCAKFALVGIAAFFALGLIGQMMIPKPPPLTPEQAKAQAERRAAEEEACKEDAVCMGGKFSRDAEGPCGRAVESLAKFDYKWTNGFGERKFTHFGWAHKEAGLLLFQGDSIQFQNGFGAFEHHIYECVFDPDNKRVVTAEARPGRLRG